MSRRSGVLLHLSSLCTDFGIGDLGPEADKFIDFLSASGFSMWQVLPVNPVSGAFGFSPYSSDSAFAGNELLISPERLIAKGLISRSDLPSGFLCGNRCFYKSASAIKDKLLLIAYENFDRERRGRFSLMESELAEFASQEASWLKPYAAYLLLKEKFNNLPWNEWGDFSSPENPVTAEFLSSEENIKKAEYIYFRQYIFYSQLSELRNRAHEKGISLIGDVPMFVCYDSADVWSRQELFDLDENRRPRFKAGVPPDYFSEEGQLWGNPLYRWDRMAENNYSWWTERISRQLKYFDTIRIDHFRGLAAAWSVPASSRSAREGHWEQARGREMLTALMEKTERGNGFRIIAEDLGIITEDVTALRKAFGFPGMKILQFAFGSDGGNSYLPHNIEKESVVYTGTHDNNTSDGWWNSDASPEEKEHFALYTGTELNSAHIAEKMNALALSSQADTVILTVQDLLSLNEEARMNVPGTTEGNWSWALSREESSRLFDDTEISTKYRKMNEICGRLSAK